MSPARQSPKSSREDQICFGIFIAEAFGMLSYASIVDVLKQMRDYYAGKPLTWTTLSTTLDPVAAANGLQVLPQETISASPVFDYVIIIGSAESARYDNEQALAWIRSQHRHGAITCGTASATWLLARSGVLKGRRCTLHWRDIEVFREAYPDVEIVDEVYVVDERIVTCSGAATASDMVYHLLGEHFGHNAIRRIQEILFHERLREPHQSQRQNHKRIQLLNPEVYRLMQAIDDNVEGALRIGSLCDQLGLNRRVVENVFREHIGISPKQYQLELRLTRAARMLNKTAMSIPEIAVATGFSSASHLSSSFSRRYGVSPLRYRRFGPPRPQKRASQ